MLLRAHVLLLADGSLLWVRCPVTRSGRGQSDTQRVTVSGVSSGKAVTCERFHCGVAGEGSAMGGDNGAVQLVTAPPRIGLFYSV